MYAYIYPLFLLTHSLIHNLTEAIMHTHITLEPQGDEVKQFDKVCEVQSDKANVEITSRYDGVVKELVYGVGDTAHVGKPLMMIEIEEVTEEHQQHSASKEEETPVQEEVAVDEPSVVQRSRQLGNEKILTTPAVRRIAREHDVDLQLVLGTFSPYSHSLLLSITNSNLEHKKVRERTVAS